MTYSKVDLTAAFDQVLRERVPDLSDVPEHTFSDRFEQRMQKLIRREAAHPWAVSHTAARNLLVAALIAVLLFALSMSVSGVRNAIYHFFTRHFDTYDELIFDDVGRTEIEHVYKITALPEGFNKVSEIESSTCVVTIYDNKVGETIQLTQELPFSGTTSVDNERAESTAIEIDNQVLYYSFNETVSFILWGKDGYKFNLSFVHSDITVEQILEIYRSIQ